MSRFVEKPDLETAKSYLAAGTFFWNTGIFLFRAGTMREAFQKFQPEIWKTAADAFGKAVGDVSGLYMSLDLYSDIPSISVDYAICRARLRHRHGAGGLPLERSRLLAVAA